MEKYYRSQLSYRDIGVQDGRIKIFPEDEEKMKKLYKQGFNYAKIAGIMNLTYANVYLHLNKKYYNEVKAKAKKSQRKYYQQNRDIILSKQKKYQAKKRKILNSIDVSGYLTKKEPKMTSKRIILANTHIGKVYSFKQIKDLLNKDYGIFSRRVKELEKDGYIKIGGKVGARTFKRIK